MSTVIRKNVRNFAVLVGLAVVGLLTLYVILQEQRVRFPLLEARPFELQAEFETAQAVVPGQGQTIRVAGIRIGDVAEVELSDGVGLISFEIDREYLPVYRDATILMRPTTALKDMFFELDPGTEQAGVYEEGEVVPLTNTAPDVNLDEILAALDGDTRAYLRTLITGAAGGLEGRDEELGELLGTLGPINRLLDQLNSKVAQRSENVAHLITVMRSLTGEVGRQDDDLARLVTASNTTLGAIAEQAPDVEAAVRVLPETLRETRGALTSLASLGNELGPAAEELLPFAGNLDELNAAVRDLATETTPVLAEQIRPFVRAAREPVRDLRPAARRFAKATPKLTVVGKELNEVVNTAAYNPRGAEAPGTEGRDEGYLYWAAWLAHTGNSVFETQDAHGLSRRIYVTASCANVFEILSSSPLMPLISNLTPLAAPGGPCET